MEAPTVAVEADPLGIVSTASFVVTAASGDALASYLMRRRGFTEEDYTLVHPAGQLGRNLILSVADLMHKTEEEAICGPETTLKETSHRDDREALGGGLRIGRRPVAWHYYRWRRADL